MASNMLSLPKGLSTLQSLSVQPCWQGLPVEMLYVPAEGGFQPALLRCSAEWHQQSRWKHFLTSTAPLTQRDTLLPVGACLKSHEQRADLGLGFISSLGQGGLWGRAGDADPTSTWQISLLQTGPSGPAARAWSVLPGHHGRSSKN